MNAWDRSDYAHIPTPTNVTEKVVRYLLFERIDRGEVEGCRCEACLVNMQAVALNSLTPWYVRGDLLLQEGEWPTLVNEGFPSRRDVNLALDKAIARVRAFPKELAHTREPATQQS
ncbi:MAG: late competence development ComFB family protein [Planctomycetota bacterium]